MCPFTRRVHRSKNHQFGVCLNDFAGFPEIDLKRSIKLVRTLNGMELSYQPTLREVVTMGRDLNNQGAINLKPALVSDFLDIYYDPDERAAVAKAINENFPGVGVKA